MKLRTFVILLLFLMTASFAWSQDNVFTWGYSFGVGARALSMGGAYTGVADDNSALYYNPAGLGQLEGSELFGSFQHLSLENRSTFMGDENLETSSYSKLNGLGMSLQVPTVRGSLVIGFGHHRVQDFDNTLYVEKFIGTVGDSITWSYDELDEGGLSNTAFGGAVEMAPGFFVGATVNFWSGTDDYTWRFTEADQPHDIWTFTDFVSDTRITTKYSGVNFKLGTLFHSGKFLRAGATIETPVTLTAKEDWDFREVTTFDDGFRQTDTTDAGYVEYKIQSPWVFRLGGSVKAGPMLVSGDVEFKDWSQMKYKTDPPDGAQNMADVNLEIKRGFRNVMNYRVGGEFSVPGTGLKLRAGYGVFLSPHKEGPAALDRELLSFGAGMTFGQVEFSAAYATSSWESRAEEVIEQEKLQAAQFLATVLYRM